MRRYFAFLLSFGIAGFLSSLVAEEDTAKPGTYVFGWGDLPQELADPRGGTSTGSEVTLAPARSLPLPEIASAPEGPSRDRAAILALAGDYRVSFHFMETLGLATDYKPTRPYHSWATERVEVVTDEKDLISLQHTLVMFFKEDGSISSEPSLTKHWRQDWTYEDTDVHVFESESTSARLTRSADEVAGTWTQSVYQVDDSPRYSATGRWEHRGNVSEWRAEPFWRPLPRRELTVRKDYGIVEGRDVIVITPTGWLHEQHNWKRVAGGDPSGLPHYVGSEFGLHRYDRITAPSLDAAGDYWKKTGPYWKVVREVWSDLLAKHDRFSLRDRVDGAPLYDGHFEHADEIVSDASFDAAKEKREVEELISRYLEIDEK